MDITKRILQIIVLALLVAIAYLLWPKLKRNDQQPVVTVSDFSTCQQAGGELIDGHPVVCKLSDGRTFEEEDNNQPEVILDYPKYGDKVTSPLTVVGKAKGNWFFEANIPVTLKDDKGNVLAQIGGQAQSDWMTQDYVPFSATLKFDPKSAETGVLIISRDNPSGLPEFDSDFAIPVKFK
ncbi:MAG: Gmad2 immunoglobulin-like domain-containing protein [Candidatus Doudnabacteria bacterium]|nr:Gmad2 immunoglobulin-like domain-containing protein [Candidatus Doudnabacteria bacterium]